MTPADTAEVESLLPLPETVFHILVALADGDLHGYGIMQQVAALTDGRMRLSPGTLYGAIPRMLAQGLVEEVRTRNAADDRRRTYRITPFGRRVAVAETSRLQQLLMRARDAGFVLKKS
jgi:DNA-binding PadR family transcriptional regulator